MLDFNTFSGLHQIPVPRLVVQAKPIFLDINLRNLQSAVATYTLDWITALISAVVWIVWPRIGGWPLLLVLLPVLIRGLYGNFKVTFSLVSICVTIILITGWIAWMISYDPPAAEAKFWAIVGSASLCYAISHQPRRNVKVTLALIFAGGVIAAVYFYLSHDFILEPRRFDIINKLGVWWMGLRPEIDLPSIHPNYLAGMAAISAILGLYLVFIQWKNKSSIIILAILACGYGIMIAMLISTTSRGVLMAVIAAAGIYGLWLLFNKVIRRKSNQETFIFPFLVIVYLLFVIVLVYIGPAQSGSDPQQEIYYGTDSRFELFSRGLSLIRDFPFTGGGLAAFPGLYSQYLLSIPFYYLPNSHNIFLDVALEQGVFGGIAFLLLYLSCIWTTAKQLVSESLYEKKFLFWVILISLTFTVIHGVVDNYLYNGKLSIFSLVLIGLSTLTLRESDGNQSDSLLRKPIINLDAKVNFILKTIVVLSITFLIIINFNKILAVWYANIGSIRMSNKELKGFPTNTWDKLFELDDLNGSRLFLLKANKLDPKNPTANYRLGLLNMMQMDYKAAVHYFEEAQKVEPNHRGVLKNLGYSYLWLGDISFSEPLLSSIPEAPEELQAYIWWWEEKDQDHLSLLASTMETILTSK